MNTHASAQDCKSISGLSAMAAALCLLLPFAFSSGCRKEDERTEQRAPETASRSANTDTSQADLKASAAGESNEKVDSGYAWKDGFLEKDYPMTMSTASGAEFQMTKRWLSIGKATLDNGWMRLYGVGDEEGRYGQGKGGNVRMRFVSKDKDLVSVGIKWGDGDREASRKLHETFQQTLEQRSHNDGQEHDTQPELGDAKSAGGAGPTAVHTEENLGPKPRVVFVLDDSVTGNWSEENLSKFRLTIRTAVRKASIGRPVDQKTVYVHYDHSYGIAFGSSGQASKFFDYELKFEVKATDGEVTFQKIYKGEVADAYGGSTFNNGRTAGIVTGSVDYEFVLKDVANRLRKDPL